jgi:hypothetical protein
LVVLSSYAPQRLGAQEWLASPAGLFSNDSTLRTLLVMGRRVMA